jgi:uncharacterized lipoprotein YddW (UPF0748 family)
MNRSDFLKTSLIGLAGITLTSPYTFGNSYKQGMPGNFAWMNGSVITPEKQWKQLFDKMLKADIGGLLIHGSNELYEKIGPIGKQSGMQIHAWRWTMNRGDYMKQHPEWYTVNRLGESVVDKPPYVGYYRWLCPSRPEVKELLIKDYVELSEIPGITGVHLDYVRYSDIYLPVGLLPKYNLVQDHEMPEYDYCYCPLCRDTFKQKHGYDPLDKEDPSKDQGWHQFRLDQLVHVVQGIASAIHDKGSIITAAVFPTPKMSREMVRQDWGRFNLDAYFPMLYHEYYLQPTEWIAECTKEIRAEIGQTVPVYPGIMVNPKVFTPEVLTRTIQQIKKAGGQGIAAFMAGGLNKEQLAALRKMR